MDQLDLNATATVPDAKAKATDSPTAPPVAAVDAPESLGHATPLGLRSSPPPLRQPTEASIKRTASRTGSLSGSPSDSEAETVMLPGVDGFSPSKIRKERNIKLEDRGNESGQERAKAKDAPASGDDESVDEKKREDVLPTDNAASLLGKRKRTKHGISRLDDTHAGNSSGLSSVPTSPAAHARSNLGKRAESESDEYRSSSPRKAASERPAQSKRRAESTSDRDKEFKRTHARRSSARDTSGVERYRGRRTKLPGEMSNRRRRTHSPSPHRDNTGILSGHRSASSGAANGLGNRKKSIPPPLRPIKSHHSAESDDSSGIESPYPRRTKTRNQGTPPTGGSMQKMAHRRNRQNRYGRTPLADAAEAGNFEKAIQLLAEFPEDIDVPDAAGNTPLQCAALNGHPDIVKLLIENGCALDCKNNDGDSPLLDAVENCHLDVVKLLLGAGVDPRARNQRGEEPIVKIDDEHEDADEIRAALQAAKHAHAAKSRPSEAGHTPQQESIESLHRKSTSHGRANRTGPSSLYERFDVHGLRDAAAKGDTERVVNILTVLDNIDDAESTLAAAKGGHIDALEMLFGLGGANPDPSPVKSVPWEFATPMLAAIGGDNTKVVKLLLQQAKDRKFDPTKRFKGKTYYEIARERAGPVWIEEERLLKEAYEEYASKSPASTRSNGGRSKDDGKRTKSKRDTRRPDMSSPVRRGPGRPRKDNHDDDEHEPASTKSHREEEAEQAKPRRKLVSGRELKDAAQDKSKPAGSATPSPPKHEKSGHSQREQKENKTAHDPDAMEGVESTYAEQTRPNRRDKSAERGSAIRNTSPAKRRQTSPTPSEPTDLGAKRRRVDSETKKRRQSDVGHGTAAEKRIPLPSNKERVAKGKTSPNRATAEKKETARPAPIDTSTPTDVDNVRSPRSSPGRVRQKLPGKPPAPTTTEEGREYVGQRRSGDGVEAEVKAVIAEAAARRKEADRQNEEAARKSDAERRAEAEAEGKRQEQEREKKRAAIAKRLEKEAKLAAVKIEPSSETVSLIQPGDILGTRASREASVDLMLSREEKARRAIEEAELHEKQRREASAERHREEERRAAEKIAEEERKRAAREEIERHQQQEMERKKREKQQERARIRKEREDARLAKLPPLLRWWESTSAEKLATPDIAECFSELHGARYDTIVLDESKRDPSIDGREQYILNTDAACLLGEKDLELTRYTGWERVPASKWALHGYWRLEQDYYSMIWPGLDIHSPDLAPYYLKSDRPEIDPNHVAAIRRAARPLFIDLPLFFVKLSDVMFVVPKKPHLRGKEIMVFYHEALPDESYVLDYNKKRVKKWRSDPDAVGKSGCPGPKTFIDGVFVHQVEPEIVHWTVRPYPEIEEESREDKLMESRQEAEQHPHHHDRGEPMELDIEATSSSPATVAAARRALPSAPTNGDSEASMNGHFAGDFAGYSMHGATGSRPNSSGGPNGANHIHGDEHGPDHPAHPSLPTFRALRSPEMTNGDLVDNPAIQKL